VHKDEAGESKMGFKETHFVMCLGLKCKTSVLVMLNILIRILGINYAAFKL
jgi:hypothetical protein